MNYGMRDSTKYLDWDNAPRDSLRNVFAVDQAKFNLSYLVFPEVEKFGLEALPDEFVLGVHRHMDNQTRTHLLRLPLAFMRYWHEENKAGTMVISDCFPEDHLTRMTIQAHKVQARLVDKEGNVLRPAQWSGV